MTSRFPDAQLNLALLPAPAVIKGLSYSAIKAERLASLQARFVAAGLDVSTLALESEPAVVLQSADALRELLDRGAINDAAKAVMMLFARGTDQDNLYALVGARRLTIVPADASLAPATPAVLEPDDDFLLRAQVALDGTAPGLTGGGYAHVALRASPEVKRVSLHREPGGVVHVVLQGRINPDGSVSDAAVRAVAAALNDDWSDDEATGSQLTDTPIVRSAVPRVYDVAAIATVPPGPAYAPVKRLSEANIAAVAAAAQLITNAVPTDALIAAGRVPSMVKFTLVSPAADVTCRYDEVPWCRSVAVDVRTVDA